MIITQFRKYTPLNIVILVVVGLLLCFHAVLNYPSGLSRPLVEPGLLLPFGKDYRLELSPSMNVIGTLLITVFQGLYLNRVLNKYNFFGKPSFLVALLYLTIASLSDSFLVLSPVLLCNFIFIWMLDKLMGIYHSEEVNSTMYDLGMLVALGSLIYFPFAIMLVALWAGLTIFRPFYWREWLAPLFGFLTIFFLLWVFYFWKGVEGQFSQFWTPYLFPEVTVFQMETQEYILWAAVLLILILSLNVLRENIFRRIVLIRKIVQLLFVMLLFAFFAIFLEQGKERSHFLLMVPPLSIYAAYYFHYAKTKWFYESVYIILFALIIVFQIL